MTIWYESCRFFFYYLLFLLYYSHKFILVLFMCRGSWGAENIVFTYFIYRCVAVVWCGWPHSICVWVCAHIHLCTCFVLGGNDSWHLAIISGSLISIERFGGEAQIPLYLSNRCVFDLLTRLTHSHTLSLSHTHTHCPTTAPFWHMEMSISKSLWTHWYRQQYILPQKNIRKNMDHSDGCCTPAK